MIGYRGPPGHCQMGESAADHAGAASYQHPRPLKRV
jgi:hypothetical protein